MVEQIRNQYNAAFTREKYAQFTQELESLFPGQLDFRVAETPLFIPKDFTEKILAACESIIDTVTSPAYLKASDRALPSHLTVPGEDAFPHFIAFDFGICSNESNELEPQLIEMQGFPSLFAWHAILPHMYEKHFDLPANFSPYLNGFDLESYQELLKRIILGNESPEHVVLLEIFPEQQKTRVDFHATEQLTGIKTVCLTQLIKEGSQLFYMREGKKTRIRRIYNRLIFDDLFQQTTEVQEKGKILMEELDLTWVPHPNWFYRYSKFSLPFIRHQYVPSTHFLHEVKQLPADLQNYVVKPLFSFAGQGVIIDVTLEDLEQIHDPENWILQKKVNYAAVIQTPDEPAKAEIRIFYFWEPGKERPVAVNNLARLSKGKMVGVRYNKDKEWVGGTVAFFQKS